MRCSRCQSQDIRRSARRGFWDNLKASMGRYPFHCEDCGKRFFATRRYLPPKNTPPPAKTTAAGPDVAFRRDEVRPTAQVVIQADDHVQLDRILLALHSAVTSYQPASPRPTAKAGR